MRRVLAVVAAMALVASPALATLSFHDDFESGSMSNWTPVAGSAGGLSITGPDQWKSIDPGPWGVNPGYSARQSDIVGTGKGNASYHDFGAQSGTVKVEAYIFEDLTTSANPIQGAIQLTGTGSGAPSYGNDYMQLGILQWSGQNAKYAFRTHHGGFVVTSVDRKKGWTKLGIEADAGVGSEVRFYIDDALVGTSLRDATDLQYMILGVNADNYENFWYDGVNITPEPASLLMLALGGGVLLRRRAA